MKTLEEIESALSRLSAEDFLKIENWMTEHKKASFHQPTGYGKMEYGLSAQELERFDARIATELEDDGASGQLTKFSGDFRSDIGD
jgi:hypothetical protein